MANPAEGNGLLSNVQTTSEFLASLDRPAVTQCMPLSYASEAVFSGNLNYAACKIFAMFLFISLSFLKATPVGLLVGCLQDAKQVIIFSAVLL